MAAWQQKDESNYKNRHNKSPMKKGSLISIYYTPIHLLETTIIKSMQKRTRILIITTHTTQKSKHKWSFGVFCGKYEYKRRPFRQRYNQIFLTKIGYIREFCHLSINIHTSLHLNMPQYSSFIFDAKGYNTQRSRRPNNIPKI